MIKLARILKIRIYAQNNNEYIQYDYNKQWSQINVTASHFCGMGLIASC